MSTSRKGSASRYVLLLGALLLAACGDTEPSAPVVVPPVVVATVSVAPGEVAILVGGQATLAATPRDATNRPLERAVTWETANAAIATVSATGTVTGLAEGEVTITATSEGKSGSALVRVARVPVAEVRLSVDQEVVLEWNGSTRLQATPHDAAGNPLDGRAVAWTSSRTSVVSVANDGTLQAQGPGTALVSAEIEGKNAVAHVRVNPVPVASIALGGDADGLEVGEVVFLSATVEGVNGAPLSRVPTWTSSNPAVATVQSNQPPLAAVRAVGAGRATISATLEGKSASIIVDISPRPSHDLVFAEWNGALHSDLYLLNLSGAPAGPVRLNAGSVSREPSPSPDGQYIVFSVSQVDPATRQQQDDLYVVRRDGLHMRQLTRTAGIEHQPKWSPDGARIAFRGIDAATHRSDLWLVNVDGTGLRNVTAGLPATMTNVQQPAWSPDGRRLAFVAVVGGQQKVWLIDADGTNLRQFTTDAGWDSNPTWSPTGHAIAFSRWNVANPAMGEDVMIAPLATGQPQRLELPGDQRMPAWSPDGFYFAVVGTGHPAVSPQRIFTMRIDGTGLRERTLQGPGWGGISPAWIRR